VSAAQTADGIVAQPKTLLFSVSDTGVGISERELNRIFDPFYTTKPVGQGTGLGLSICFGIIQEHSGRIWAESTPGAGTTVSVELPLLNQQGQHDDGVEPDSAAIADDSRICCRVLVVDDEEPVGNLLARLLRDLGHQPLVVTSGAEALEMIARESFDLVLTDVKMPGMSGFELHQQIKQRDPDFATRLVFVSGDTMSAATQARIAQSGNPYIAKPFAIERLETLVRALLARRPIEQSE
jgi:two-component system NtrC family sensor kinase